MLARKYSVGSGLGFSTEELDKIGPVGLLSVPAIDYDLSVSS